MQADLAFFILRFSIGDFFFHSGDVQRGLGLQSLSTDFLPAAIFAS